MQRIEINKYKKKIKVYQENIDTFTVVGPLGKISFKHQNVSFFSQNNTFFVTEESTALFYAKVKKSFKSVSFGWYKELNLNGIGYKSFKINDLLALDVGYSSLITYKPPKDVKIKIFKNKIVLFSIYQDLLNNVTLLLKDYATPDPYKAKGILLKNEKIKLKKKRKS